MEIDPKTGGPAFPTHGGHHPEDDPRNHTVGGGMTLRDWFAGQALATAYTQHENSPDQTAEWAYQVADAMLAAREPTND